MFKALYMHCKDAAMVLYTVILLNASLMFKV